MIPLLAKAAMNKNTQKIMLLGGGLLIVGVGYFIFRRSIRKNQEEKEKQSYLMSVGTNTKSGRAASYAVLLRDAMKGLGTDEKSIYKSLEAMKNEGITFSEVSKAYKGIFQRDLYIDMSKELNAKDMAKANSIIQIKGLTGALNGAALANLV